MNHGVGLSLATVLSLGAAGLVGLAAGVGGYTFVYAQGASYLTDRPEACANCHVMREQLEGWLRSSHRAVATCNDCHTPHTLVGKYATKARNGFWHSYAFTSGDFVEPIQMHEVNRAVTERACRDCHGDVTHAIDEDGGGEPISCIRCHGGVGHE
ncbi:MAG: cytochrome c nitrite reductase small subunit [Candidatus Polarisedimenticolia bacterium]